MKLIFFDKLIYACLLTGFFFFLSRNRLVAQQLPLNDEQAVACSNNAARSWWDVQYYNLSVDFRDTTNGEIKGINVITAKVISQPDYYLQIDLDTTLKIIQISIGNKKLSFKRSGSAYFLILGDSVSKSLSVGAIFSIRIVYEGRPVDATNPPWDGGFVRTKDKAGELWWAVACQGQGASLWFPCKNFQGDEPDYGVTESYTVPASVMAVGNGRLIDEKTLDDGSAKAFTWKVVNPINNYDITFYIGNYVHWADTFNGLKGKLDLNYYVLPQDLDKAKKQFTEVKTMLRCFENHFGPYPFYEDGYKLVEAPYLGMEHQSAIAYGNQFKMGYLGEDRSGSGVGLLFDFIIVHESGHEWFGNSITAYDKADEWIHEGFTSYAETVYAECIAGKAKAFIYQQGKRRTIRNDKPVEGKFGQCDEGSGDAYDKAGFMIHQIRVIMDNDSLFFAVLKAMNTTFYHQIVTGKQIEQFISDSSRHNFSKLFDQYLRQASLPVLVMEKAGVDSVICYWKNCVPGFDMPVKWSDGKQDYWLHPSTRPQKFAAKGLTKAAQISKDFLINIEWTQ